MGYRSMAVTVINSTGENLILVKYDLEHGEWKDKPESISAAAGSTGYFKAESKGGSLKGVEGYVTWNGGSSMGEYKIDFKKPQSDDPTTVDVTVPDGYTYILTGDKGGHDSEIGITFQRK